LLIDSRRGPGGPVGVVLVGGHGHGRAHRSHPLVVPLARAGAFMQVLEAVRVAPEPAEIPPAHRRQVGAGRYLRHVVDGIEARLEDVATHLRTFGEAGTPWAVGVGLGSGG
jgi:hypothetical protein